MSSVESLTMLVAQLQQTVLSQAERLRHLEERVRVLEQDAPPAAVPALPAAPGTAASVGEHRAQERAEILVALNKTGWNRLEAARLLAVPRRTLYRRMVEYGIQEGDSRAGVAKREKERAAARHAPITKKKAHG